MAPRTSNVGGENPEFVLRDFGGVNCRDAREGIDDEEFWWLENYMPLGKGNLVQALGAALLTTIGETDSPTFVTPVNVGGADYLFAVWQNSGNGYAINLLSFAATLIITGLTSGQTFATQYNDQGLLIVDPTGYWDYNVTTANTLTPQNNSAVAWSRVSATSIAGGSQLKQILTVSGTGGAFQTLYSVTTMTNTAAGTGYAVGDTLSFTDNSPITPAQIVVSAINGSGGITGFTISTGGSYQGPNSSTLANVGPAGSTTTTTGAGSGAHFTTTVIATTVQISVRGTGYANTDTLMDETSGAIIKDSFLLTSSGVISGTSIATYAGRVWIGYLRTIFFTDINSYNYFGGAGGSFTINDAYLHAYINALFSANNYLYIFGDDSIDALSNVTVSPSTGVTSFSRINITASIGCSSPLSIFAYFRGIAFYWNNGCYVLSGSTPEKISDKILGVLDAINPSFSVWGCPMVINSELCATFLFTFLDAITQANITRSIFAIYFKSKWWFYSFQSQMAGSAFVPIFGTPSLFAWSGDSLYNLFSPAFVFTAGIIKTKFWDGGAPLREKQSVNVAIGATLNGAATSTISFSIDEEGPLTTPATLMPNNGVLSGYTLMVNPGNQGGKQYLGLSITTTNAGNVPIIGIIAMRAKTERDALQ